ncbi:MAG TPA: EamA family transporter [Steroidobacteraceae bacterium]
MPRPRLVDLTAVTICTLSWGTTWYAITFQLGIVDPVISLVYRFSLAAALLFAWCALRAIPIRLSTAQHAAACGMGLFTFSINYTFVYLAETRITSAVVAVMFAMLSLVNLAVFRIVLGQRAPLRAWTAASLGAVGVAILSWSEIIGAHLNQQARMGFAMACVSIVCASLGNVFAHRRAAENAPTASLTAWAMLYGTAFLALYALAAQRAWRFEANARYIGSLIYLAVVGSVVAFLFFYGLARRRGYSAASYITALTPIVAMTMSSIFEGKTWGAIAIVGVACALLGQWLFITGAARKP